MTWSPYQVSLRILSPIHIGWRKTGNLQQTRPYVTGKTLWGALTARLVRDGGGTNYQEIGEKVDNMLIFTYFYPTTNPDKVEIWPWGNSSKFSWSYLGSYPSTALSGKTAEEGSLHETECISPKTRNREQVYLIGYIIEKDGCGLQWRDAMQRIQLGGERGYGWGRVELVKKLERCDKCFGYSFDGTKEYPILTVPKDGHTLAHTLAEGLELIGTIEPFVGRETSKERGFGGKVSVAGICWDPGSIVDENKTFEIRPRGLWSYRSR